MNEYPSVCQSVVKDCRRRRHTHSSPQTDVTEPPTISSAHCFGFSDHLIVEHAAAKESEISLFSALTETRLHKPMCIYIIMRHGC